MTTLTQKQIDAAIKHFISCAIPFETARDNSVFESAEYWDNHDKAMNLLLAADSLMPRV